MTNPDENVTVNPSFTVGEPMAYLKYEKKAGDFNNEGIIVSIPLEVPAEGVGSQEFLGTIAQTLENAKVLAWDALRLDYTYDAEKGVTILAPQVQAATPPPAPPRTPQAPPQPGGGDDPQPDRFCGLCNSATFNNTTSPKAKPTFPDFKCKNRDCNAAMWLTGRSAGEWQKR